MPKVALVTGSGAPRVGWHVAQALAAAGYSIALHFHRSREEAVKRLDTLSAAGHQAIIVQADLASEPAVRSMVDYVIGAFGRIDVLVNTAAIWNSKRLEEITADDLRSHWEINTLGTFLTSLHVGLQMVKQAEGGTIITIGDWADARPYLNYAAYFASKGSIPAITRTLAVELGTRNPRIRVNGVLPGPVMLPEQISPQERKEIVEATLVQREGSPTNIAKAVLSFLENDFVTGTCLTVDGGRTIFAGHP